MIQQNSKQQSLQLQRVQTAMKSVAESLKLPKHSQGDLAEDLESLDRFNGTNLIWLLRTNGSVLVPTHYGVDPTYVTHWLWGNHGQEVIPFIIGNGVVERCSLDAADKLIHEPPFNITLTMPPEELIAAVDSVLENGCTQRIWGVFASPESISTIGGWNDWQNYFASTGNRLMSDFLGKAIRYINLRKAA